MIYVEIDSDLHASPASKLVEYAARSALDLSGATDGDLTLVLTGDDRIQALNRDFLGKDAPTDVLSFPSDETDPETGRHYLGDVIISIPRAAEQAGMAGSTLEAEVQLLVAHGVLHLLGYDHASVEEKTRMWAVQAVILERLGVPPTIINE